MKNKLPKTTRRWQTICLNTVNEKIDMITAYLEEKEGNEQIENITIQDLQVPHIKPEIIRVPDNIVFHKPIGNRNESVGLINDKQQLYYNFDDNIWHVWNNNNSKPIPMKLVKCNYEDIEVWEFFYSSNLRDISDLSCYRLKLIEWEQAWCGNDCLNLDNTKQSIQYYKVTPIQ